MRKILFSTILCMASVATFAQKVTGIVVDEKGKALQHVSLQLVENNALVTTSDDKFFLVWIVVKTKGRK